MADAINANANLQALGVTATVVGNRVVTTGDIETIDIRDNGLSDVLELNVQRTQLWWGNVEAATAGYDVVRGTLTDLRGVDGDFSLATQICAENDGSETFVELLAKLRQNFDWVVIDSPPLASLADSVVLATLVEMSTAAAAAARTSRLFRRAFSRMAFANSSSSAVTAPG